MEIWKDIKGYEGLYQVSNLGRVKSLGNDQSKKEKILKGRDSQGYHSVMLYNNGKKAFKVHRLVGQAFILNPENKLEINHKNGIKADNKLENLEWCTHSENGKHRYKTLGHEGYWLGKPHPNRGKTGKKSKLSKVVMQYDIKGKFIKKWVGVNHLCKELGFSVGNISNCCNGKLKTAYGFLWKYNII